MMFACGQCLLGLCQIIAILSACSIPILCKELNDVISDKKK